jgi:hypothetical protein
MFNKDFVTPLFPHDLYKVCVWVSAREPCQTTLPHVSTTPTVSVLCANNWLLHIKSHFSIPQSKKYTDFILVDIRTRHAVCCSNTMDRQPQDQLVYCYFCLAYSFSITTKMKHTVWYQTLPWPIMPVTHHEDTSLTRSPEAWSLHNKNKCDLWSQVG